MKPVTKTCYKCRALRINDYGNYYCKLGHKIRYIGENAVKSNNPSDYATDELCERPVTIQQGKDCMLYNLLEYGPNFGDVLFRPLVGYGGMEPHVHTSLVKNIRFYGNKAYVISVDASGQLWADKLDSIGREVFRAKAAAARRLPQVR